MRVGDWGSYSAPGMKVFGDNPLVTVEGVYRTSVTQIVFSILLRRNSTLETFWRRQPHLSVLSVPESLERDTAT